MLGSSGGRLACRLASREGGAVSTAGPAEAGNVPSHEAPCLAVRLDRAGSAPLPSPHHQLLQPSAPRPQLLKPLGPQEASRPQPEWGPREPQPGAPGLRPFQTGRQDVQDLARSAHLGAQILAVKAESQSTLLLTPPLQVLGLWGGTGPEALSPWPLPHPSWSQWRGAGHGAAACCPGKGRAGKTGLISQTVPARKACTPSQHQQGWRTTRDPSQHPRKHWVGAPWEAGWHAVLPAHLLGSQSWGCRTRLGPRWAWQAGSSWRAEQARCSEPQVSGRWCTERPGSQHCPQQGLSWQRCRHAPLPATRPPAPHSPHTVDLPKQRTAPVRLRSLNTNHL